MTIAQYILIIVFSALAGTATFVFCLYVLIKFLAAKRRRRKEENVASVAASTRRVDVGKLHLLTAVAAILAATVLPLMVILCYGYSNRLAQELLRADNAQAACFISAESLFDQGV